MENQQNNYTPISIGKIKNTKLSRQPQIIVTGAMLAGLILFLGIFYGYIQQSTSRKIKAQIADTCSQQGGVVFPNICPPEYQKKDITTSDIAGGDTASNGLVCCTPIKIEQPTVPVVTVEQPTQPVVQPTEKPIPTSPAVATNPPPIDVNPKPTDRIADVCVNPNDFNVRIECSPNQAGCNIISL